MKTFSISEVPTLYLVSILSSSISLYQDQDQPHSVICPIGLSKYRNWPSSRWHEFTGIGASG